MLTCTVGLLSRVGTWEGISIRHPHIPRPWNPIRAKHGSYLTTLVILPNGRLAWGLGENAIELWDMKTDEYEPFVQAHSGIRSEAEIILSPPLDQTSMLAVLPDERLVWRLDSRTIELWDLRTPE